VRGYLYGWDRLGQTNRYITLMMLEGNSNLALIAREENVGNSAESFGGKGKALEKKIG